jgi:hypothetical protein
MQSKIVWTPARLLRVSSSNAAAASVESTVRLWCGQGNVHAPRPAAVPKMYLSTVKARVLPGRASCGDSHAPIANSRTPSGHSQTVFGDSQTVFGNSQTPPPPSAPDDHWPIRVSHAPNGVSYPPIRATYPLIRVNCGPIRVNYPPERANPPSIRLDYPSIRVNCPPMRQIDPDGRLSNAPEPRPGGVGLRPRPGVLGARLPGVWGLAVKLGLLRFPEPVESFGAGDAVGYDVLRAINRRVWQGRGPIGRRQVRGVFKGEADRVGRP